MKRKSGEQNEFVEREGDLLLLKKQSDTNVLLHEINLLSLSIDPLILCFNIQARRVFYIFSQFTNSRYCFTRFKALVRSIAFRATSAG